MSGSSSVSEDSSSSSEDDVFDSDGQDVKEEDAPVTRESENPDPAAPEPPAGGPDRKEDTPTPAASACAAPESAGTTDDGSAVLPTPMIDL